MKNQKLIISIVIGIACIRIISKFIPFAKEQVDRVEGIVGETGMKIIAAVGVYGLIAESGWTGASTIRGTIGQQGLIVAAVVGINSIIGDRI